MDEGAFFGSTRSEASIFSVCLPLIDARYLPVLKIYTYTASRRASLYLDRAFSHGAVSVARSLAPIFSRLLLEPPDDRN